jgi:hypothetical protein
MKINEQVEIEKYGALYLAARARRRKILRAIKRNSLGRTDLTVMDRDRWAAIYDLRLMEVSGVLEEIQHRPDFGRIQTWAFAYRYLAPASVVAAILLVGALIVTLVR